MDQEILSVIDGVRNVLDMYLDFDCLSIETEMVEDGIASILVYARRIGEDVFNGERADAVVSELSSKLSTDGVLRIVSSLLGAIGGNLVFHRDDERNSMYYRILDIVGGNKKQKMGVSL